MNNSDALLEMQKAATSNLAAKATVADTRSQEWLYDNKTMEEARQSPDSEAKARLRDLQPFYDATLQGALNAFQQVLHDGQPHARHEFLAKIKANVNPVNVTRWAQFHRVETWINSAHQTPCPIKDMEKTVTEDRAYQELADAVADDLLKDPKMYEQTGDHDGNWQLKQRTRGKKGAAGTPDNGEAHETTNSSVQGSINETTSLISLDTPILPAMPLDVLPSTFQAMVRAVATNTETPPELAVGFGLAVIATTCQGYVCIEVEPNYREPLNIWPLTALESGNRKTAVMNHMTEPLVEVEREQCQKVKEKVAKIESERETIKAKVKALRVEAAEGSFEDFEDKKQAIAKLESTMPELLTLPRFWVQDITPEKLGQVMAENGERIALISDEGGLFDTLAGRYSNGIPNLDLILQAHAGTPVRVHRGSRPDVVMNRPALTIALSPQPSVLHGLASQPGFRGRGLLARFLYTLPVSRLGYRTLTSQPIPPSVKNLYQDTITTLLKVEPTKDPSGQFIPHVLTLAPEAHAEWKEFQHAVEEKMRDGGDYEHIRDWAGKLPGAAARLAGLLHCAEHA